MSRPLSIVTRWLFVGALLFAVSGGVAALVNQGARNQLLSWAGMDFERMPRPDDAQKSGTDSESETPDSATPEKIGKTKYFPLPAPDRQGVVHLDSPGPYLAQDLTAVGALTIVGDETSTPQIVIGNQSMKLCAETIQLRHLKIIMEKRSTGTVSSLRALLRVECQNLTIEGCSFDAGGWNKSVSVGAAEQNFAPPSGPALIAWKLLDGGDQRGGIAVIRQSVLLGDGPALYLANAVRQVSCENMLKAGPGPLMQLAATPAPKSTLTLKLNHATLRAAGAIIRWVVPGSGDQSPPNAERNRGTIQVEANDCVLDIASPQAALFELAGSQPRAEWLRWLRFTGEGSITRPTLDVAAWVSTLDGQVTTLSENPLEIEGLTTCEFGFAGKISDRPANSEVRDADAPRRSAAPPGIRAADLPR